MDDVPSGFTTPFNAVAAFPDAATAKAAVGMLTREGVPMADIHLGLWGSDKEIEEIPELRAEMQDELGHTWGAPAFLMTGPQAKGALVGTALATVAGIAVGLIAGLAWAYLVDDGSLNRPARVAIVTMLTAVGFATAGFIAGGSFKPRRDAAGDPHRVFDDRRTVGERDALVGVHSQQQATVERSVDLLRRFGADRVDLFDATGTPLPPQHEHPRPADPRDFWWRRAGQG